MIRVFKILLITLIITSLGLSLQAGSKVRFTVNHLIFKEVQGRFREFSGEIDGDSIIGSVRTESIYTGNEDRDQHLLTPEFLFAEKYPEISFRGRKIKDGGRYYRIIGDLTIRGKTKRVELTAHEIKDNRFVITGVINRFDFGVSWNKMFAESFIVGKDVRINLNLVFK